jgi:hypothetical protein
MSQGETTRPADATGADVNWLPAEGVVSESVGAHVVLVDPQGRELLTLNGVASVVWSALDGTRGVAEIAEIVTARFGGVEQDKARTDVAAFLSQLQAEGLVVPR